MATEVRALWETGQIDPTDGYVTRDVVRAALNEMTEEPVREAIEMVRRGEITQEEAQSLLATRFRAIREGRRQGGAP